MLGAHVGSKVHPRRVEPAEKRFAGFGLTIDEIHRGGGGFVVDGFHPLFGQWTGVFNGLLADTAKAWIFGGIVPVCGLALEDTARAQIRAESGIARVVEVLRFFLGVEVIEIAEEFVEAMYGGQKFVTVAEMVLAELAGGVA